MKLLTIVTLFFTVSCGKQYIENDFNNTANEERFKEIEARVLSLENQVSANILTMNNLTSSIESNKALLVSLSDELRLADSVNATAIQSAINQASVNHSALLSSLTVMQSQVNLVTANIATLSGYDSIVEYIDPCGDMPNQFDEILLKTKSGKLIAYFEQGNKRFLTVLEKNVRYMTTDSQQCLFSVNNSGQVIF